MKTCFCLVFLGFLVAGCSPKPEAPVRTSKAPVVKFPGESVKKEEGLKPIIDSDLNRSEALGENEFPKDVVNQMEVIKVGYLGFDGRDHVGQLVVHRDVAEDVIEIFKEIRAANYPIVKMVPIVEYGWHDQKSIDDQNTSGFNYRKTAGPGVLGTTLSKHSFGKAIDLNPYQNPFVAADGATLRPYVPGEKGVLTANSAVVKIFKKYGWKWGGDWSGAKDYQHFEKP